MLPLLFLLSFFAMVCSRQYCSLYRSRIIFDRMNGNQKLPFDKSKMVLETLDSATVLL